MRREEITEKLLSFGYKQNTIDKLLQGRINPTTEKAIRLHKEHDIPFLAWEDIKSYLNNDTKHSSEKSTTSQAKKAS